MLDPAWLRGVADDFEESGMEATAFDYRSCADTHEAALELAAFVRELGELKSGAEVHDMLVNNWDDIEPLLDKLTLPPNPSGGEHA